jgi:hypothetical protein
MASAKDVFWREARDTLRSAAQRGVVIFRFSAIHMMEITHIDERSKPMGIARGQIIKELCGRHCLTFWQNLVLAEGLALAKGVRLPLANGADRDDGRWFPNMASSDLEEAESL